MSIFLIILIILIVSFLYLLLKQLNKNILIIAICTIIIVYFILFPKECILSTVNGARMFFFAVFPSLFPFLIICNVLISFNGIKIYSKLFGNILCKPLRLPVQCSLTIIISSLCGYPIGAKYCIELYEKKMISSSVCQRLLNIASNAGPIFVIGTVGTAMLNSKNGGYLLLLANYTSCIIMSFLIKPSEIQYVQNKEEVNRNSSKIPSTNIGKVLKDSIDNAIKSSLSIGGYIIFFAVLIELLNSNFILNAAINLVSNKYIPNQIVKGFLLGLFELTKGCQMISVLSIPIYIKYSMIGFLMGFSGLSIISQVYSFTYIFPEISMKLYIKRKLLQGFACALVTPIYLKLFTSIDIIEVFTQYSNNNKSYLTLILYSLLILPIFIEGLRKLFHSS